MPEFNERRPTGGEAFNTAEVAQAYRCRPGYPEAIFTKLRDISPAHHGLLDIGCGPGKIAGVLGRHYKRVTAVDVSAAMLAVARDVANRYPSHIKWVEGRAEDVDLPGAPFDLVVAGASIHWMDQPRLVEKLNTVTNSGCQLAIVEGDGALNPPWQAEWEGFLARWIQVLTGETYHPSDPDTAFNRRMTRHRSWLKNKKDYGVEYRVRQRIEDFVTCQHSRETFAPVNLGDRIAEFDYQLTALLHPYARDGWLTYTVQTRMEWGTLPAQTA